MIRDTISNFRNKTLLNRSAQNTEPVGYQNASEIGILINVEDIYNISKINDFVAHLSGDHKNIKIICYHRKEHLDLFHFEHTFLTSKDYKWYGRFSHEKIKDFTDTQFDFIYVISKHSIHPFESILVSSRAKCKIGPYEEGKEAFYDFMIKSAENENMEEQESYFDTFLDQMLLYSKLLSK